MHFTSFLSLSLSLSVSVSVSVRSELVQENKGARRMDQCRPDDHVLSGTSNVRAPLMDEPQTPSESDRPSCQSPFSRISEVVTFAKSWTKSIFASVCAASH